MRVYIRGGDKGKNGLQAVSVLLVQAEKEVL